MALVTAEVVFAPVAVLVWNAHASVWPYLAGTGVFELVYFGLLATAYRLVPLSVVYPLARGGAPVLVLLIGVVFLGHGTSWSQVAAVALIVARRPAGARARPGRRPRRRLRARRSPPASPPTR